MLNDFLIEIAADTEVPADGVQPEVNPSDTQTEGTQPVVDNPKETPETETPLEFDIDGEKVTAEQIKEWKNGNLRQQDYTRKTQELASERSKNKDAIELYNYMVQHPEIARKLAEYTPEQDKPIAEKVDPVYQKVDNMAVQLKTYEIQNEINSIIAKDKDVTEVELINLAQQNNTTITNAYQIWRGMNLDKIVEKKLADQSKSITEKLKKNKDITSSIISPGDSPNNDNNFGLTEKELEYAKKLDMTPEDYHKWKK